MELSEEILVRIKILKEKYDAMGQDMVSYLDGLIHADYLTYWDYIHLDTLLSLQTPKTSFPDEKIFIMYHQITELYFKMILCEMQQISEHPNLTADFFHQRLGRVNRYFDNLTHSFSIMVDGMEREQFLQYRMSLLPASGFQSAQYRMIELSATDLINLVDKEVRESLNKNDTEILFKNIYWRNGATELASGKKTLTLKQFEEKYDETFLKLATSLQQTNIWQRYLSISLTSEQKAQIEKALKEFDTNVNVNWPLAHYKSAVRYLQRNPEDIKATGGTNWQKYLPPRFQKRIFYPQLFTESEIENWGKGWVEQTLHSLA